MKLIGTENRQKCFNISLHAPMVGLEYIKNSKTNLNNIGYQYVQCPPPQEEHQVDFDFSQKEKDDTIEQNINMADHSKLHSMLRNLNSFIDENKGQLEHKDFDKSYKIWSGFHIVAQLENLGLGPKFFPDLKKVLVKIKSELEEHKEEALQAGLKQDLVQMKPATLNLLEQIFQVLEYLYRADLKFVDDYRSSFKTHRELKSILGDEIMKVTKLVCSGDLMVEFKLNDQAKKLEQSRCSWTVSLKKSLNSSKGVRGEKPRRYSGCQFRESRRS
ncbi:fanconi anemia group j protein [Plakobranchus ocellatus]|uniref:Fanconi anemia group j protein n=1 Tax=Plakobranchus ocellatus TaxID=259542 RepID=A0AAV4B895_9GAST|nr:fanconi anemia group j protein [Plakobranchus ocellatus]